MKIQAPRKALALLTVLLMFAAFLPGAAWGAAERAPAWSVDGTRWDVASSLPRSEQDRFNTLWTSRFFDDAGLQAYFERPGLYDDGFNALSDEEKAALTVGLVRHWQATIPQFGLGLWTGEPEADQASFEELAVMLHLTLWQKDALLAAIAAQDEPAAMGPPTPADLEVDAGNPEFPGMSQAQITEYFRSLHAANTVVTPRPAVPTVELAAGLALPAPLDVAAPPAPSLAGRFAPATAVATPSESPEAPMTGVVELAPLARLRQSAGSAPPGPGEKPAPVDLPTLDGILSLVPLPRVTPSVPDPDILLNTVAAGTYIACGGVGDAEPTCSPVPVPLGTPVPLNVDGDPLTGVGGMDLTVLLSPTIHPDFALGGFSAMLRVDRTVPSAVPVSGALPAQAFALYTPPGGVVQILAGFDGRDGTLGDTQTAQVTLKDLALALAGDVRILGEVTREGPGPNAALLAGFTQLDASVFPPAPGDRTMLSLHFAPAPTDLTADLRFVEGLIQGHVVASSSPTVTAAIEMVAGTSERHLVGIVESMPTDLAFTIESEAVGAVGLDYVANAPFPRFELHDELVFDVSDPAAKSTLHAIVRDIPDRISFDLDRPFNVAYSSSARVGDATIVMAMHDAEGVVTSMGASVQGIPSQWSIQGVESPFSMVYSADGNIDAIDATLYDREGSMLASAHVEDIPVGLALSVSDERILATTSAPVGLITASVSIDGLAPVWLAGEFASFRATSGDAIAAAVRVVGFQSLDVDQRVLDRLRLTTSIAGGEPFTALIDTPEVYATASLSNLPTTIVLDLTSTTFTYDMAQAVGVLAIHGELADLVADVTVTGLPDQLSVSWTPTSLVYDANTAITRLQANLQKGTLAASADVVGIPADWTASWPNGVVAFSTPTAVTSLLLQARVNGGTLLTMAGDHLTLSKVGSAIGVELKLSGLKAFSASTAAGGTYSLTLAPGGQPFNVYANVDGMLARAFISNLPTTVTLDLAANAGSFSYLAATPIARVWAEADAATGPLYAFADLNGLPARVDIDWAAGAAPTVVYDASGSITSIYAFFRTATNSAFEASITSIPAYLRLAIAPNDISVDARTSAAAASASGTVGAITARYGSDNAFITGTGNHANFYQSASVTRASVGYSGLKYIRVGQAADSLFVDVQNSAPRYFTAYADTPEAYVSLFVDSIPAHVQLTGSGTTFSYNAFGSTIDEIGAYFDDREGIEVSASVRGIPGSATLNANLPASTITYTASTAITAIDVDAWVNEWYGLLRISGVPTGWSVAFGGGAYGFDAGAGSIGSVRAAVTNHGSYGVIAGNHLNLRSVNGGNVDASFLMTAVQKASFARSGTQSVIDLRMGGGTPFSLLADATLATAERVYLSASFAPLPSSIQATFGDKVTITNSQNFDLNAYFEFGTPAALTATSAPPLVHGASVRDGASGSARGIKARVYLTGLPTSVTIDQRNASFSMTSWRPTTSTLTIDAILDNFVSPSVDAFIQQSGIPSPQSITFNMDSTDSGSTKQVKVDLTQTAGMGQLYADLLQGTTHGRLVVSNIPDDIHVTYTSVNGATSVHWDATAAITSADAYFRIPSQSASFQGYVNLDQLPSDFDLTFGRASGGQGPTMTYDASASTLDVNAFVAASLFGGDLRAQLSFGLTNLGAAVDVYVSGSGIRFVSSPATSSVFADVWATYDYYTSDSGTWDEGGMVEFPWAYHLGVNPTINDLSVSLTNFSDFTMAWGVTSKLAGNYGTFSLGWGSFTVDLHAYGKVQIRVDWPWPFGSSTIDIVNLHYHPGTISIDVLFHKYDNHQSTWFGVSGWAICDWSLSTTIKPHPHTESWNGFSVTDASATGGAWYVVPNPWGAVPSVGVDLAARFTSPDGGSGPGLSFDYDCI